MANVLFTSDLHFAHRNIMKFSGDYREGNTWDDNAIAIVDAWNAKVTKRDIVWVMGDVVFGKEGYDYVNMLNGKIRLVGGNHDNIKKLQENCDIQSVHGLVNYKGYWLSHCPIHEHELTHSKSSGLNIHGHVHQNSVKIGDSNVRDLRYLNVCVEAIGEAPISLDEIRSGKYWETVKC